MEETKRRPKPRAGKKLWPVTVEETTRYHASLIAALYHFKIGEVIDRAVICYANALRISDKMEQEFPKDGLETPERDKKGIRRPPNLRKFQEHTDFFARRHQKPVEPQDEQEPS